MSMILWEGRGRWRCHSLPSTVINRKCWLTLWVCDRGGGWAHFSFSFFLQFRILYILLVEQGDDGQPTEFSLSLFLSLSISPWKDMSLERCAWRDGNVNQFNDISTTKMETFWLATTTTRLRLFGIPSDNDGLCCYAEYSPRLYAKVIKGLR